MKVCLTILIGLVSLNFWFGCGTYDDIRDNDSIANPPPDASNQIPTVTIEELQIDKARAADQIWWRLNASPAPKTDLAVRGSFRSKNWVVIPKLSNHSEEFKDSVFGRTKIEIHPLPIVSIVGKGVVIDLERLQKTLPAKTRGNHIIPVDYDFPVYKVGEPSSILIFFPDASFTGSIPADGSELAHDGSLTINFDTKPLNVTINGKPATVVGNTAILKGPHPGLGPTPFNIAWLNGPGNAHGAATINLNIKPPK
jgi:hypothetical protein